MKKIIALTAVLALSFTAISEAKGARGGRSVGHSRPVATKPAPVKQAQQQQQTTQQPDATFNQQAINAAATKAPVANQGNRLASFATGAAAGYLLSEVLAPTEAHAQTPLQTNTTQDASLATAPAGQQPVTTFKAFDASNPALVGMTGEQSLFCLNGALYLVNKNNNQMGPVTDNQAKPIACSVAQ
ncbi:hypothetical protein ACWIT3_03155 [Pasteurella sp. P03HT]